MPRRSHPLPSSHPHPPRSSSSIHTASVSPNANPSSVPLHFRRQFTPAEKFTHLLDNDIRDLGLDLPRPLSLKSLSGVDHPTPAFHNSDHELYHDLRRWSSDGFINANSSTNTGRFSPGTVLQPQPLSLPLSLTVGTERKLVFPADANGGKGGVAYPLPSPNEGVNRGQNDKGRVWDRGKGETIEMERFKVDDRSRNGIFVSPLDFHSGRSSRVQEPQSPVPRRSIDNLGTVLTRDSNHIVNLTDRTLTNPGFQVPFSSAPSSRYPSPVLSPRRMSTGDLLSNFPNQMTERSWSSPEMPHKEVHSGPTFTSLQDKALFGLDYSSIQSPQPPTPKRVRHSIARPTSPGSPYLFPSTPSASQENNGNIDSHIRPHRHSKSRPTSPVRPKLFINTTMVRHKNCYNLNGYPFPPSMSHPTSPVPRKFSADTSNAPNENNTVANGHPLPTPPSPKTPVLSFLVIQITPKPELQNQWSKGKFIGRGTYGSVYEATNKATGAMCAMKEVELCPDDPMAVRCMKQLEQEIEVLSHLKHRNIVQYYGSEIIDDRFYIYLELVYPGSINKYSRETALSESVVRNFTRHILSGLAYLHSTKTIHRDIKGANLLVDASGVVKLTDFGMAKHLTEQAAELSLKGSPYWMAPELIQAVMHKDKSPDLALAVDIWSLGCTVIEMFTGRPPWHEHEGAAAMFKALVDIPPLPNNLSEEGKDFLLCCFSRDPAERPSASVLLEHPFVRNSGHPVDFSVNTQSSKGSSTTETECYRSDWTADMFDQRGTMNFSSRELWEKGFI